LGNIVRSFGIETEGIPMIDRLQVSHRLKSPVTGMHLAGTGSARVTATNRHAFRLDTCLREVTVELQANTDSAVTINSTEILRGVDAYRLLLEVATGLRSAIPGETNVFGQFRRAWQAFLQDGHPAAAAALTPLMHRLFNDTKAIRNHWLEGIGGSSYGSLVRRLIAPRRQDRVLFVGAGELMRTMLPLFGKFRLGVWNHRIVTPTAPYAERLFSPGHGQQAAAWADHVILTTPCDQYNDRRWCVWLDNANPQTIVHLGRRHAQPIAWPTGVTAFDLDDVFSLQRDQAVRRSSQLDSARAACAQFARALHRQSKYAHRPDAARGMNRAAA